MVRVQRLEIEMKGKMSEADVVLAAAVAAMQLWWENRGRLQEAFNAMSMRRAGLGRIS